MDEGIPSSTPQDEEEDGEEGGGAAENGGQCEMCANYEMSLQTLQTAQDTLREQLAAAKELYEKYGKELSEERLYRKELEGRFAALNDEIEQKIQIFADTVCKAEERTALLAKKQETDLADMGHELDVAKERQTSMETDLKTLYEKYQRLLHKNAQKAEEMREQCIDLPQTVDELTLLALQLREDLISEKTNREHECQELRDELTVAREQMLESEQQLLIYAQHAQQQQDHMEQLLEQQQQRINNNGGGEEEGGGDQQHHHGDQHGGGHGDGGMISNNNNNSRRQQQRVQGQQPDTTTHTPPNVQSPRAERRPQQHALSSSPCRTEQHQHRHHQQQRHDQQPTIVQVGDADRCCCCPDANKCHQRTVLLEHRLHRSMNERAQLQELLVEQRNKCAQMQSELDTSEAVQKDFVRLSQNLQVDLEKIRQSESEVRWQDEQDVGNCNDCTKELQSGPEHRINCRHCGKIFCSACTSNTVLSGPTKRAVPVCALCYALLSNHSLVNRLMNATNGAGGGGAGIGRQQRNEIGQEQQQQL